MNGNRDFPIGDGVNLVPLFPLPNDHFSREHPHALKFPRQCLQPRPRQVGEVWQGTQQGDLHERYSPALIEPAQGAHT